MSASQEQVRSAPQVVYKAQDTCARDDSVNLEESFQCGSTTQFHNQQIATTQRRETRYPGRDRDFEVEIVEEDSCRVSLHTKVREVSEQPQETTMRLSLREAEAEQLHLQA